MIGSSSKKRAWRRPGASLCLAVGCVFALACEESEDPPAQQPAADAALSADARADARVSDAAVASKSDASSSASTDAGPASTDKVGEFSVQLVAPVLASESSTASEGYSALLGKVFDGPATETTLWTSKDQAEGCTLLTPKIPFCDRCGSDSVCVADDTCQKSPSAIGVGSLHVKGVKTQPGDDEFTTDTTKDIKYAYQTPMGVSLAYPAFGEGDAIELALTGDSGIAAFTLTGKGIATLELIDGHTYPLTTGKGLALTWKAPTQATGTRILVKLDISHHGGSKGKIECDLDDDGSFTVPAKLVDALAALGVAGFPSVSITRSAVTSALTARGRIDLRLFSYLDRPIEIPGVISCTGGDTECPTGKSCRSDKTCG
jgi:hypothetical protein